MLFELSKFDEYKEDNRREVKRGTERLPVSLWDTYSSFANSYGGIIILGVKENKDGSWQTTGLSNERKLLKEFWDIINNRKKININLLTDSDVQSFTDEKTGNVIIVVTVPAATRGQRPVYINNDIWNGTFRRNWEGDYHCTPAEIKAMLRDQPDGTMDMKVIENLTVEQLNANTVRSYRNRHRLVRPGHIWSNLSDGEYLEMIGAAARTSVTLSFRKRLLAQNKKVPVKSASKKVPVKSASKKVPVKSASKKLQKKTLAQLAAITEYMKTAEPCTAADLCDLLEVKDRRVRQLLKYLEEDGKIEIIGTYRNRRYKLK